MLNRHIIIFWLIASCRCLFWCAKPFLSLSEYELLFAIGICNGIIRSVIYPKSHSYPCYYMLRYTLSPMYHMLILLQHTIMTIVPWENKADLQRWKQIITWKQYIESRLQIWMLRVGIGAIVKIISNCSYSFTLWSLSPELFQFILWSVMHFGNCTNSEQCLLYFWAKENSLTLNMSLKIALSAPVNVVTNSFHRW